MRADRYRKLSRTINKGIRLAIESGWTPLQEMAHIDPIGKCGCALTCAAIGLGLLDTSVTGVHEPVWIQAADTFELTAKERDDLTDAFDEREYHRSRSNASKLGKSLIKYVPRDRRLPSL